MAEKASKLQLAGQAIKEYAYAHGFIDKDSDKSSGAQGVDQGAAQPVTRRSNDVKREEGTYKASKSGKPSQGAAANAADAIKARKKMLDDI
jgi:hypothetical protein